MAVPARLALNPDELNKIDPLPGIQLAQELGVGVEIRMVYGQNILLLDDEKIAALKQISVSHGVPIVALATPLFKWTASSSLSSEHVDSFRFPTFIEESDELSLVSRAVDIAKALEVPVIRTFSRLRNNPYCRSFEETLADALQIAQQHNISILLENEPVCNIATTVELLRILTLFHKDGLGLWLDFANLHDVGEATARSVAVLAPHIRYLHLKDYIDFPSRRCYCVLGEGQVPWVRVASDFSALDIPYIAVETHISDNPEAAIRRSLDFARTHLLRCA